MRSGERKELKQEKTTVELDRIKNFFPFSAYEGEFLGCVDEYQVSVFDCKKKSVISQLVDRDIAAIAALHGSEGLVTVSSSGIKIWDNDSQKHTDNPHPIFVKPTREIAFESHYDCTPLSIGYRAGITKNQLYVLPDNKHFIYVGQHARDVLCIDFDKKKSEVFPLEFIANCSAYVEPHYLVLASCDHVHVYDLSQKDVFKKPSLMKFNIKNVRSICVWPGGHLWAIVRWKSVDRNGYNVEASFTLCKFAPGTDKPLVQLFQSDEDIHWSYAAPVIAAGKLYYCPVTPGFVRAIEIKSLDPQTGITQVVKKADAKQEIAQMVSTTEGLFLRYWDEKIAEFFPVTEQWPLTKDELKEAVLDSTKINQYVAGIIADYAVGFFKPNFPAPRPLLPEEEPNIQAELNAYIKQFGAETETGKEITKLLQSILDERTKNYSDLISSNSYLVNLLNVCSQWFPKVKPSPAEKSLAEFLVKLQNLDKKTVVEFKRL